MIVVILGVVFGNCDRPNITTVDGYYFCNGGAANMYNKDDYVIAGPPNQGCAASTITECGSADFFVGPGCKYNPNIFNESGCIAQTCNYGRIGDLCLCNWNDSVVQTLDDKVKTNVNCSGSGSPLPTNYSSLRYSGKQTLNGSCPEEFPICIGVGLVDETNTSIVRYGTCSPRIPVQGNASTFDTGYPNLYTYPVENSRFVQRDGADISPCNCYSEPLVFAGVAPPANDPTVPEKYKENSSTCDVVKLGWMWNYADGSKVDITIATIPPGAPVDVETVAKTGSPCGTDPNKTCGIHRRIPIDSIPLSMLCDAKNESSSPAEWLTKGQYDTEIAAHLHMARTMCFLKYEPPEDKWYSKLPPIPVLGEYDFSLRGDTLWNLLTNRGNNEDKMMAAQDLFLLANILEHGLGAFDFELGDTYPPGTSLFSIIRAQADLISPLETLREFANFTMGPGRKLTEAEATNATFYSSATRTTMHSITNVDATNGETNPYANWRYSAAARSVDPIMDNFDQFVGSGTTYSNTTAFNSGEYCNNIIMALQNGDLQFSNGNSNFNPVSCVTTPVLTNPENGVATAPANTFSLQFEPIAYATYLEGLQSEYNGLPIRDMINDWWTGPDWAYYYIGRYTPNYAICDLYPFPDSDGNNRKCSSNIPFIIPLQECAFQSVGQCSNSENGFWWNCACDCDNCTRDGCQSKVCRSVFDSEPCAYKAYTGCNVCRVPEAWNDTNQVFGRSDGPCPNSQNPWSFDNITATFLYNTSGFPKEYDFSEINVFLKQGADVLMARSIARTFVSTAMAVAPELFTPGMIEQLDDNSNICESVFDTESLVDAFWGENPNIFDSANYVTLGNNKGVIYSHTIDSQKYTDTAFITLSSYPTPKFGNCNNISDGGNYTQGCCTYWSINYICTDIFEHETVSEIEAFCGSPMSACGWCTSAPECGNVAKLNCSVQTLDGEPCPDLPYIRVYIGTFGSLTNENVGYFPYPTWSGELLQFVTPDSFPIDNGIMFPPQYMYVACIQDNLMPQFFERVVIFNSSRDTFGLHCQNNTVLYAMHQGSGEESAFAEFRELIPKLLTLSLSVGDYVLYRPSDKVNNTKLFRGENTTVFLQETYNPNLGARVLTNTLRQHRDAGNETTSNLLTYLKENVKIMGYDDYNTPPRKFVPVSTSEAMCRTFDNVNPSIVLPSGNGYIGDPNALYSYGANPTFNFTTPVSQTITVPIEHPKWLNPFNDIGLHPTGVDTWCKNIKCVHAAACKFDDDGFCVGKPPTEWTCYDFSNETCDQSHTGFTPCVYVKQVEDAGGIIVNNMVIGAPTEELIGECVAITTKVQLDTDNYKSYYNGANELLYKPACVFGGSSSSCKAPTSFMSVAGDGVNTDTNVPLQSRWFTIAPPVVFFEDGSPIKQVDIGINTTYSPDVYDVGVARIDPHNPLEYIERIGFTGKVATSYTYYSGKNITMPFFRQVTSFTMPTDAPNCGPYNTACKILVDNVDFCPCSKSDAGTWKGSCVKPTMQFYTPDMIQDGMTYYPNLFQGDTVLPRLETCDVFKPFENTFGSEDFIQWPKNVFNDAVIISNTTYFQFVHYCDKYRGGYVYCENDPYAHEIRDDLCTNQGADKVFIGYKIVTLDYSNCCIPSQKLCYIFPGSGPFGSVGNAMKAVASVSEDKTYTGWTFNVTGVGEELVKLLLLDPAFAKVVLTNNYDTFINATESDQIVGRTNSIGLNPKMASAFCSNTSIDLPNAVELLLELKSFLMNQLTSRFDTVSIPTSNPEGGQRTMYVNMRRDQISPYLNEYTEIVYPSVVVGCDGVTWTGNNPTCTTFSVNSLDVTLTNLVFDYTNCSASGIEGIPIVFSGGDANNSVIENVTLLNKNAPVVAFVGSVTDFYTYKATVGVDGVVIKNVTGPTYVAGFAATTGTPTIQTPSSTECNEWASYYNPSPVVGPRLIATNTNTTWDGDPIPYRWVPYVGNSGYLQVYTQRGFLQLYLTLNGLKFENGSGSLFYKNADSGVIHLYGEPFYCFHNYTLVECNSCDVGYQRQICPGIGCGLSKIGVNCSAPFGINISRCISNPYGSATGYTGCVDGDGIINIPGGVGGQFDCANNTVVFGGYGYSSVLNLQVKTNAILLEPYSGTEDFSDVSPFIEIFNVTAYTSLFGEPYLLNSIQPPSDQVMAKFITDTVLIGIILCEIFLELFLEWKTDRKIEVIKDRPTFEPESHAEL